MPSGGDIDEQTTLLLSINFCQEEASDVCHTNNTLLLVKTVQMFRIFRLTLNRFSVSKCLNKVAADSFSLLLFIDLSQVAKIGEKSLKLNIQHSTQKLSLVTLFAINEVVEV